MESRSRPSAKARSGLLRALNAESLKGGHSFPTWVVFDNNIHCKDPESFPEDDPETPSARSRASNGDDVLVSFRLVAPPGASYLCLHYPRGAKMLGGAALLAAHLDSVLFRVVAPSGPISGSDSWCCHADYFVCKASTSGLSIYGPLPPCYIDERRMAGEGHAERSHMLDIRDIGLLRRGDEEFAVADLKVLIPDDNDSVAKEAELFRYRSNALSQQWEVKRMQIHQGDNMDHGLRWWTTDKVVSFEGYMCWIDYYRGILFCDVLADDPHLWYAALPVKPPKGNPDHPKFGRAHPFVTRSLCVTDCNTMVFVNVERDDGEIASKRKIGSGFTMTSWSLGTPLSSTTIRWEKIGAMRAEEMWMYFPQHFKPHIPFLSPEFPFVRLNEHNIVYALLCERQCAAGRTWVLVIDMESRKLKLVIPYNEEEDSYREDEDNMGMWSMNILTKEPLLPSVFSMYLNKHGSCCDDSVEGLVWQSGELYSRFRASVKVDPLFAVALGGPGSHHHQP